MDIYDSEPVYINVLGGGNTNLFDSIPVSYSILGGAQLKKFDSVSSNYTAIGGSVGKIFYESEVLSISSQVLYCFGKDANNNITPPLTAIAIKISSI